MTEGRVKKENKVIGEKMGHVKKSGDDEKKNNQPIIDHSSYKN